MFSPSFRLGTVVDKVLFSSSNRQSGSFSYEGGRILRKTARRQLLWSGPFAFCFWNKHSFSPYLILLPHPLLPPFLCYLVFPSISETITLLLSTHDTLASQFSWLPSCFCFLASASSLLQFLSFRKSIIYPDPQIKVSNKVTTPCPADTLWEEQLFHFRIVTVNL